MLFMPTHGSLTKAGKVRNQTPQIASVKRKKRSPQQRNRRNYHQMLADERVNNGRNRGRRRRRWSPPTWAVETSIFMTASNARIIRETCNGNALIGGPAATIKTATIPLHLNPRLQVRDIMNVGDEYQLDCGHPGKVIWISADEQSFAVQGKRRSCINCGKKTSGTWTPTVYKFQRQA